MIKMNKSLLIKNKIALFLLLLMSSFLSSQDSAPSITATGRQAFCVGDPIQIVTDFSITDIDDTTIGSFFIQISTGYQSIFDKLDITNSHPTITSSWSSSEGKLTLSSSVSGSEMLLTDLEKAVKDVIFISSSTNPTSEKTFSLSIGDADYLPSTDHFYEFVSLPNITWTDAKVAAENKNYFGRQGYLATLTSQEESDFAGKQASGPGWIGGSDEETEGVWKWVTGPEAGTNFWNGQINGTTPNFAFWNNNEPNNSGDEDYAHITDPSIGVAGAWNDLPNEGGTGSYIPKGYIVEYGTPSDPPLSIVATTSIYIPQILSTTDATICESGSTTISATPSEGTVLWFNSLTGGTQFATTGTSFTTPILTNTTTYYATVSVDGCVSLQRTAITVTVNQRPIITSTVDDLICSGTGVLKATSSAGQINWYNSMISVTPIFTGNSFTTPDLNTSKTYYVSANNSSCESLSRTAVTVVVDNTTPEFDLVQSTYVLCNDVGSITLETTNWLNSYTYVWKKEGVIISGNNSSVSINSDGNYSVSAISESGCQSDEKEILVRNSTKAALTKDDVIIVDDSNNNSIYVTNPDLGIGEYEFSLDDEFGSYKDIGFFQNISSGIHMLHIKDKLGCGIESYKFSILSYPKFFTPNEDGDNDIWEIKGFDTDFYTVTEIYIYDRFGVLLYQSKSSIQGWDGTSQGKILPSNTYWFRIILNDVNGQKTEKTGSLSLIRK